MNPYRTIEQIMSDGSLFCLGPDRSTDRLSLEVRNLKKKMILLPTARESEALPEIMMLKEFSSLLLSDHTKQLRQEWQNDERLEQSFIEELFEVVCIDIIKARIYTNKEIVRTADALFNNLVIFATQQLPRLKTYYNSLLNTIIDKSADYYKTNGKENSIYNYPFGELFEPDESHKKWVDSLTKGDRVDALRNYAAKKNWSRAIVEQKDSNIFQIRYINDINETYIQNKYFEIAPAGSKESDFEWRESLKEGDLVDYYSFKSDWMLYRITKITEDVNIHNEVMKTLEIQKEVKPIITDQRADEDKNSFNLKKGNLPSSLDNLSDGQSNAIYNNYHQEQNVGRYPPNYDIYTTLTTTVKASLPSIAKPGKYSLRVGNQIDDSEDSIFLSSQKRQRFAILRANTMSGSSSIYLVKYINTFGERGGFDFILNALNGRINVSQEIMGQLVKIIQSASENLVEPFIKLNGDKILQSISNFVTENAEKNLRTLSQQNLLNVIESVNSLAQRIYNSKEARNNSHMLMVRLGILCLKSDILEKQFFGAKQLLSIETKTREFDSDISRNFLANCLLKDNIFEKIIKGHPGLIAKGSGVLKILLSENKITNNQLSVIWDQICKTDVDSRSALLVMVKEIQWEFSKEQIQYFVKKMLEDAAEINSETFDLLCSFRRIGWNKYNDSEVLKLVNDVFWEILQSEKEIKKDLSKEVMQNFIKSLDTDSTHPFISKIIENYLENKNQLRNLKLLRSIMKQSEVLCSHALEIIKSKNIVDHCTNEIVLILNSKIKSTSTIPQIETSKTNFQCTEETLKHAEMLSQEEKFKIQLRLKLFRSIFKHEQSQNPLFTFSHFEKIWEIVFDTANNEDFIHTWIHDYILSDKISIYISDLKSLFSKSYLKLLHPRKSEFFKFFVLIFHKINIHDGGLLRRKTKYETLGFIQPKINTKYVNLLSKPTERLFGIKNLWEIFEKSINYDLFSQVANYLTIIYLSPEFFENENDSLYPAEKNNLIEKALSLFMKDDHLKAIKASLLFMRIIKSEERKGSKPLISLAGIKEGEKLVINIEKDTKYLKDRTKISIYENQTIGELKELVSREYRISTESIIFVKENEEEIPSSDNTITLESAGIRMRDLLIVRETELPEIIEANVLNETGDDFSETTYKVFHEIFTEYSLDSKMTQENLAKFTSNATDGSYCSVKDERITYIFDRYDTDRKGYILEENFIDFYRQAAIAGESRLLTVRKNLQSLGYGKDLRLKKANENEDAHCKQLLRYRLCVDEMFNRQLLSYVLNDELGLNCPRNEYQTAKPFTEDKSQVKNTLYKFIELLSPNKYQITKLIEDPINIFESEKHPMLQKYNQIILHALIFKIDECQRMLRALDIDFNKNHHNSLLAKVAQPEFAECLLKQIAIIDSKFPESNWKFNLMFYGLRIIEKIFKVIISFDDLEMISDMKNFMSFFIKQKKKITEKTQPELPEKKENNEESDKFSKGFIDKEKEDENSLEEDQIKQIRQAYADKKCLDALVDHLNFPNLNTFVINLLNSFNEIKSELQKYQKAVLKTSMLIFISSLKIHSQNLPSLLKTEMFQKMIFAGLAHEKGLIRLYYKNFYAFLTSNSNDMRIKIDFLKILINNISNQNNEEFHSLIELACNILGEIGEMKSQIPAQSEILHSELNFSELFGNFSTKLLKHRSSEVSFDEREDSLLIGYLSFMEKILKADELVLSQINEEKKKNLVWFIFRECLFEITNDGFVFQNIKCKSKKSRSAATNLLVQLLKNDIKVNLQLIIKGLSPLSKNLPNLSPQTFGLSNDLDRKNQLGFLGIKNLGCVCYMIAMLQQFYCTPAFRHGILMSTDNKEVIISEVKGNKIDDNLFHQIQKMFAYLDFSERRDFNPLEFCLSYKDYTGQPVNVMVQQDADEFLKVIFDKLEEAVKSGPYIGILNSVYSGKICNVIICKGCGFEKVNEEAFNNLSLEVKNLSNLNESFEKFIEEEIISEYMCDKCKNKCDISKKALLKSLPNVLIVYLKKMVFDVDLLMNIKIHSKYEFPMNINLKNYMHFSKKDEESSQNEDGVEAQIDKFEEKGSVHQEKNLNDQIKDAEIPNDADEYEYKLTGVVIHKGNAEYGHYTSLINVNRNDSRRTQIDTDLWLEFDDSRVSKFDMNHFQEECFGNSEDKDFPSHLLNVENHISKSAYILIYDKIKKSPIVFPFTPETLPLREKIISSLRDPSAVEIGPDFLRTSFYNLKQNIPAIYSKEIENDNSALVLEQQLLSSTFTNSLAEIFSNVDLSISFDKKGIVDDSIILKKTFAEAILQTLPNFLFKIYCVSNDNYRIGKIVRAIESALNFLSLAKQSPSLKTQIHSIDQKVLQFYIDNIYENLKVIIGALINSSDQFVRNSLSDLLVSVFNILVRNFNVLSFDVDPNFVIDSSTSISNAAQIYLIKTVNILLGFIPGIDINAMQFRKLGYIFTTIQRITDQNVAVRQYLLRMGVLNSVYDLYLSIDSSKISQLEKSLSPLLSLIHVLILQLQAGLAARDDNYQHYLDYYKYFIRVELFTKILKEDYSFNNFEALKGILSVMAFENQSLSDQAAYICLKGIASSSDADTLGYLEAIKSLLSINDDSSFHRIKTIFGIPRLNEQGVILSSNKKSFLFGLSKESYLKKAVFSYTSTFGSERGLLEILFTTKEISENSSLLLIYYILELSDTYPNVLTYLTTVHPPNYLSATFYDWFKGYSEYHLKYSASSYSTYKSEVATLYFNSIPEKLVQFQKKIEKVIENRKLKIKDNQKIWSNVSSVYSSYGKNSKTPEKESADFFEIFSFKKNYIIGRTNKVNQFPSFKIDEDEMGEFKMKFQLINVSLMESQPTGSSNHVLPQYCLNYDKYINKSAIISTDLIKFLGLKDEVVYDDREARENTGLTPLIIEDDPPEQEKIQKVNIGIESNDDEHFTDNSTFINRDYILRVSLTNKTNENYFIKIKIHGSQDSSFDPQEFIMPVRARRSNFLVQNVLLNDVDGSFRDLKVSASVKKLDNLNMKHFSDEEFTDYTEVFDMSKYL
jgi:ubiquitin carboxyl-terminal hydrolase 34